MGSENDKKRLDVEVDRLSSLPDDIIHKILSFCDTLDAIQTSTLSSRWRFIWTTMTCLAFSSEDFPNLHKFSKFVKHVLSGRDDQREVSSVKLTFRGKASQVSVKRILEYAFSHNVQQLDITCLAEGKIEFPLSLFSSQTLKHLNFKDRVLLRGSVILTSTLEVPALTALHLNEIKLSHDNTVNFSGLIYKCVNLKNLTLTNCYLAGSNNTDFNIFHSQLSNLALERVYWNVRVGSLSVVAPQLKNLIIRRCHYSSKGIMISAPDLAYLLLQCHYCLKVSADDFHSLEKADISITDPYTQDLQKIVGLFQVLHSVKDLTLNVEIIECLLQHLSSSAEIISHQHSPLANLKSIKIYPLMVNSFLRDMSTEVKNYLLDSSPRATFTMVTREEIMAKNNVKYAKKQMAELQVRLEQEKADIETNRGHIEVENVPMESRNALMDDEQNALDENELQIEGNMAHINSCWESLSEMIEGNVAHMNSCWESLSEQIEEGKEKIDGIVRQLSIIRELLTKLPASKRAEMQPCFSSLSAQANNVMSKIRDCMKIQYDENQSRLNVCFHELATTLQSSS